ncbi:hypothetical protein TrRE_jg927, partial [Triparma retinervis]
RRLLALGTSARRRRRATSRISRIISGLIIATADECENLDVEVDVVPGSPLQRLQVNSCRISFSRLGFAPLRIGGLSERDVFTLSNLGLTQPMRSVTNTVDEAFQAIDVDSSGKLDRSELATALANAMARGDKSEGKRKDWKSTNPETIVKLAGSLLRLYDTNGDGELDRNEYAAMVEDIAMIRRQEGERLLALEEEKKKEKKRRRKKEGKRREGWGWPRAMKIKGAAKRGGGGEKAKGDKNAHNSNAWKWPWDKKANGT